jgi:hypothetical protein
MRKKDFQYTVSFLWEKRELIKTKNDEFDFDFPDYGGLPKTIYYNFSSDVVDAIQHVLYCFSFKTKRQFAKAIYDRLDYVGEPFRCSFASLM